MAGLLDGLFQPGAAFGTNSPGEQAEAPRGLLANLAIAASHGILSGIMAPGQVYNSQTPMTSDQMIGPAMDTAGLVTLGAGAMPAEVNSLRSGMSFPLYHGSPTKGLSEILPSERGALGPGAYFTPAENVASRYGGNVYELPSRERDIFNGLGDRYGSYEGWKSDKARLIAASEPERRAELQAIMDKMWISDGYPMHKQIANMYRDEAKAQELYKRAGFEGFAGHADGPEVVLFGPQGLK